MFVATTWKSRPLSPEQTNRMMTAWGKLEASQAESPDANRLCWFIYADGSGGLTVSEVTDADAGAALQLETSLILEEFLEIDSRVVLDLETALPVIEKAVGAINS